MIPMTSELIRELGEKCVRMAKWFPWIYMRKGFWAKILCTIISWFQPGRMDQRMQGGTDCLVREDHWETFLHAPTVIFILRDRRGVGDPILDCGLAAHTIILTAHALGLGTCYIGFSEAINHLPSMKKRLGIEWPYDKIATAISIGYPRVQHDGVVEREIPPIKWIPESRPDGEA